MPRNKVPNDTILSGKISSEKISDGKVSNGQISNGKISGDEILNGGDSDRSGEIVPAKRVRGLSIGIKTAIKKYKFTLFPGNKRMASNNANHRNILAQMKFAE
ncbi:MAG: hypothetical protein LBI69_03545 [Puniceicoccales bacterium]|jgi:hypothetical protein|nr:hypothetical protein [Puniceicoccales bacterium]